MKKLAFIFSILMASTVFCAQTTVIPLESGTPEEIEAAIDEAVSRKDTSQATINLLIDALESPEREVKVKERAAWALGQLEAQSAVPTLIEASHHKGLLVRSAALNALIRMRPRSAFSVFTNIAQNDPVLALRQRATVALGLLQWEKAVEPLVKLSSDEREEVRGASVLAMTALHSPKSDFSTVFSEMLADPSPYVQERAKFGLAIVQRKNAVLQTNLKADDSDIRLFTAVYFQNRGGPNDLTPMNNALEEEASDEVRYQLNKAIKAVKKRIEEEKEKRKNAPVPVVQPNVKPATQSNKPTIKSTPKKKSSLSTLNMLENSDQ